MLLDEVDRLVLRGGHGGVGAVAFYPGQKSGPSGGNGGRGGDLYIQATSDLTALNQFSKKKDFSAENGRPGASFRKSGADGKNLTLYLPIGTELTDLDTKESITLSEPDQRILIAKGGLGGRGNFELKSPRRTTPEFSQPGLPGEERQLKVNLKLIADFGLIGLPNAGKSSLLNELTRAQAKVASYPFTTLEANLGVLGETILADIPGLIEGASLGKGLGIKFLKHIERVKVLLHCLASDSDDLNRDYQVVREELGQYNFELLKKDEIILLTKSDLLPEKELKDKVKQLKKLKKTILLVSVYDYDSIEKLKAHLHSYSQIRYTRS